MRAACPAPSRLTENLDSVRLIIFSASSFFALSDRFFVATLAATLVAKAPPASRAPAAPPPTPGSSKLAIVGSCSKVCEKTAPKSAQAAFSVVAHFLSMSS